MKKTVRLTERDLTRIIKRIINEENEDIQDGRPWGHDNQEQEEAADQVIDKMGIVYQEVEDVVKILYQSGLMSYPEAQKIKRSIGDIHEKINYLVMKIDMSTTDLSADWDRSQQTDIYNSNRDFINNRISANKTGN